jgi:uncharacterized protein
MAMLLGFRVSNFRSLRDEQELSLLRDGPTPRPGDPEAVDESPWDSSVGTVAGIYGANASGKSNVLGALIYMRRAVVNSYRTWDVGRGVPTEPFALDPSYVKEPSLFEVQVYIDGIRYQYGFRVTSEMIVGEWLYAYPGSRRQIWFERDVSLDEPYYFGKNFTGKNRTIADLTRTNSLFLSSASANNHKLARLLYDWFDHNLQSAAPDDLISRTNSTLDSVISDDRRRSEISDLMRFADLGIEDIRVRPSVLPDETQQTIRRIIDPIVKELGKFPGFPDADEVYERSTRLVEIGHKTAADEDPVYLPLTKESLGTRVWLGLTGSILHAIAAGGTFLVDELDASLHPRLTAEVLKIFRDPRKNPKQAQIIFTTHDTALLGNLLAERELLRDQVWFTEKNENGATVLYPLTDFSPRKAENLERGYLQGRYGAVPILDDRLILSIAESLNTSDDHG